MNPSRVEVRDLMDRIRNRVRPTEPDEPPMPSAERPPLMTSPNLAHLNRHWVIEDQAAPSAPAPRKMLRWLVPRRLRQFAKGMVRDFVFASLETYLLEEREFLAHLVKLLNETAVRLDALERDFREVGARSGQTRARLLADLEAMRLRADQLHGAIERRLESGALAAVARGRGR